VEEMETAQSAKAAAGPRKVVTRCLRRLFSPGTIVEESMIGSESRPACCFFPSGQNNWSVGLVGWGWRRLIERQKYYPPLSKCRVDILCRVLLQYFLGVLDYFMTKLFILGQIFLMNYEGAAACWESSSTLFGVCVLDASTGQFDCGIVEGIHGLEALLKTVRPHEIIHPRAKVNVRIMCRVCEGEASYQFAFRFADLFSWHFR
jgi:DNA mismatch repair ATPase MutS